MDTVVNGTAKAWVNFNGQGTVAIRRAFNVSSITDNGTGDYVINFTKAMADSDYSVVSGSGYNAATNTSSNVTAITSSSSVIFRHYESNSPYDVGQLSIAIFS